MPAAQVSGPYRPRCALPDWGRDALGTDRRPTTDRSDGPSQPSCLLAADHQGTADPVVLVGSTPVVVGSLVGGSVLVVVASVVVVGAAVVVGAVVGGAAVVVGLVTGGWGAGRAKGRERLALPTVPTQPAPRPVSTAPTEPRAPTTAPSRSTPTPATGPRALSRPTSAAGPTAAQAPATAGPTTSSEGGDSARRSRLGQQGGRGHQGGQDTRGEPEGHQHESPGPP